MSTITKKKENHGFTCPNPSCGRTFANPIKAENLALKSKVYDACPYCLTEITIETNLAIVEEKEIPKTSSKLTVQKEPIVYEGKQMESPSKVSCQYNFGYLSQRSTKEKIPEECMACEKIVQCMLQSVRS